MGCTIYGRTERAIGANLPVICYKSAVKKAQKSGKGNVYNHFQNVATSVCWCVCVSLVETLIMIIIIEEATFGNAQLEVATPKAPLTIHPKAIAIHISPHH